MGGSSSDSRMPGTRDEFEVGVGVRGQADGGEEADREHVMRRGQHALRWPYRVHDLAILLL